MTIRWSGGSRWPILFLWHVLVPISGADLAISYCSPDNNAGAYTPMWSQFQTTGLCGDRCTGSYAFAIVQGNNCWCSNYIPANQQNTYDCNQACPGFQSEWCGNSNAGLYGYFQLPAGNPLGTSGSGSSGNAPSTSSSVSTTRSISSDPSLSVPSSSRPSSTSLVTVVPPKSSVQVATRRTSSSELPEFTSYHPSSTSIAPSSTYIPPFSSEPSITSTPIPTQIYTSITTVTGKVQTIIITPTASADATLGQSSTAGGHGVSTGKVVGIVLGVAILVGLVIGVLIWLWFRRKRRQERPEIFSEGSFVAERSGNGAPSSEGNSVPSRQVSQMSSSGLLGKPPRIMTNGLMGDSDLRSAGTSGSNVDRRSVGTDQRLNPWALYTQEDRGSSVSLQDNQDYSRQLKIANPD